MILGFTGTRQGMSPAQDRQLAILLTNLPIYEFHHGDARGADTEAASLAKMHGWTVKAHPAGTDPLGRNKVIVKICDLLIAAPLTDAEMVRSGTWATVRYARKAGKPIIMLSRGDAE